MSQLLPLIRPRLPVTVGELMRVHYAYILARPDGIAGHAVDEIEIVPHGRVPK